MASSKLPPRNYFTLRVPEARGSTSPVFHDRLTDDRLSGALELEIEALSPLFVGSGAFGIFEGQLVKEPMRRQGTPIVPGTSIKGMCRQTFEVLTESGAPFQERFRKRRPQPLSAAARLFGALGYQGRVSFDDALPRVPAEPVLIHLSVAYPPQRAAGRRFYGPMPAGAEQPRKIPALALPAGTRLETVLRFRNLERAELGGVLLSLGVDHFAPRLGGGKYDDYGCVRFRPLRYRLRQSLASGERRWVDGEEKIEAFTAGCLEAFQPPGTGRQALETLRRKLVPPTPAGEGDA